MVLLETSSLPIHGLVHFPFHDALWIIKDQTLEMGHILAQTIEDPQILQNIQDSWRKFIETGQVWALIIGFIIGYIFRTFTGY